MLCGRGARPSVQGAESVVVVACRRGRRRLPRPVRIVHDHPHPPGLVHDLDAVDVAPVVGNPLGAEHATAGIVFNSTHAVRQVVSRLHSLGTAEFLRLRLRLRPATTPGAAVRTGPRGTRQAEGQGQDERDDGQLAAHGVRIGREAGEMPKWRAFS